jgi:hypothetical protein
MNSSATYGKLNKEGILASSRELIQKWTTENISNSLKTIDDRLFNMANESDNNDDQNRFYQSRLELQQQQHAILQAYLKHIYHAFDNYLHEKDTALDYSLDPLADEDPEEKPLSLVDNSELEESLALGAMSRKINADCSELLYALNQRFSVLSTGRKITTQGNPVAPAVYAEAIQEALKDLKLDNPSKIWIYKIFESAFMAKLTSLYETLNSELSNKHVLPNLSHYIQKNASQQNPLEEQLPEELKSQLDQGSLSNQVNLFESIRNLQSQLQGSNYNTQQPRAAAPAQVIAAIQQLQINAGDLLNSLSSPQDVANSSFPVFIQQAKEEVAKTQEVDTAVIEIVGLLFEYMLNDQQLPDSVKALLSYLHTPFLKIALQDKNFFEHPEHPARQLLNSLVAAGERWVEPFGKHKSDVFQQIKTVVSRLLNEFDDDVRIFSELAFSFNQYLRQHSRRIRLAEKRAQQAAQGENKLKEIRLKVDGYLKKKIGQLTLPPTINTLLFEPWANFLSFNLLRYGSRSEQWRQAAETVDDIIWYCQASNSQNSHARSRSQELLQTLPPIIQAGFDTVGYDNTQSNHLLNALFKQKTNTAPNETTVEPIIKADIDEVDISKPAEKAIRNDELLLTLKKAEFGTWFEFNAHTKTPKRVKLAWSNSTTLQFMFVNRLGQQVAVLSGEKLALNIRSGKIKMLSSIENKPFFEKAMERVLEQLHQKEQNTSQ